MKFGQWSFTVAGFSISRLSNEPHEDHAAYLRSWLKVLKGDAKAIFIAASHAQRAADYLNGCPDPIASEGKRLILSSLL